MLLSPRRVCFLVLGVVLTFIVSASAPHAATVASSVTRLGSIDGFVAVAVGGYHACGLTANGGVKCWGSNDSGQLGDGTTLERHVPVDVVGLTSGVTAIAAGTRHTCALTAGGGVKCWGSDAFGRLGDGGSDPVQSTPVDVVGLDSGVVAIAAGEAQTCAVTDAGAAKCWGWNRRGVLGDGTTDTRRTPTAVYGLNSGVIGIATGMFHSCAILATGSAKCWGAAGYGQLGSGRLDDSYEPVDVVGVTDVTSISLGTYHTCAVDHGGVKCWGLNDNGQLGDGTTDQHITPFDVTGLTQGVLAVDSGGGHNCALMSAGGVKCWGGNFYGQLGDGTTVTRYTPVDVIWLNGTVNSLSAGSFFSCAVYAGDALRCWGMTSDFALSPRAYVPLLTNNYAAPHAQFTAQPTTGFAPLHVTFDDTSTGNNLTYAWDFGDGVTSTLASPVHTYAVTGTYTATLTVSDGSSSDSSATTIVALAGHEMIYNGGFELGTWGWLWDAEYAHHARIVTTEAHSGQWSVVLGIEPPTPLEYSYATVTYPVGNLQGVSQARLSFWYWPRREGLSGDPARSRQFAYVTDTAGHILQTLFEFDEDLPDWQYAEFDLTPYAGQSIMIRFGVYHDGNAVYDKRSALYVDDVSLLINADAFPVYQLAAYYPFIDGAHDASWHGHDGDVYGAYFTNDRLGRRNSAYHFNGLNAYVRVAYDSGLSFQQDLTVAAWVKTTDDAGGIAHQHNGGADGNFVFGLSQGGRFRFGRSATVIDGAHDSQAVNDGQWHFLVGVYDHTHQVVRHYVDGALVLTYDEPEPLPDNHLDLIIGDENNHLYAFDGDIDEVRLYSRALSQAEIQALFVSDW